MVKLGILAECSISVVSKVVGSFDKLEDDEIKTETCTENNEISEISSNRCDENTDEAQENNSVDKTSEKSFMKDQENMSDKICDKDDDSRAESGTEFSEDENSRKCVDNIEEVQLNHLSDDCYKKNFMDDQGKEASIPDRNCDKVEDGKADIFENIEDIQENNLSDKSLENNFLCKGCNTLMKRGQNIYQCHDGHIICEVCNASLAVYHTLYPHQYK